MTALAGTFAYRLATRTPLIVDVIRDRNALFREVHGDHIENAYTLKVINLDSKPHRYRLQVSGVDEIAVAAPAAPIDIPAGTVSAISTRLQVPSEAATGIHAITFTLSAVDDPRLVVREKARFIGPRS